MEVLTARFDLSDEEWAVIEPLLPQHGLSFQHVEEYIIYVEFRVDCSSWTV